MKQFLRFLSLSFLAVALTACGGSDDSTGGEEPQLNSNRNNPSVNAAVAGLEFPHVTNERIVVKRITDAADAPRYRNQINYCIGYDDNYKLPRYVCYQMYSENSVTNVSRWYNDPSIGEYYQYPEDTDIPVGYRLSNENDPFWNSGYDHGHMIPSADRLSSKQANVQTFSLSNMLPQVNGFNARVWANMEAQIRTWNRNSFRTTLYVVTGGSYQKPEYVKGYIGSTSKGNRIPIPGYFWKAVLCENASGYKALGFWIEHKASDDSDLKKYVVNIDKLEQLTGLDFFCNLPDNIENTIEAVSAENVARSFGYK